MSGAIGKFVEALLLYVGPMLAGYFLGRADAIRRENKARRKRMVVCGHCRKEVTYSTQEVKYTATYNSSTIEYTGLAATCTVCNNVVYVSHINDLNLAVFRAACEQKKGGTDVDDKH